MKHNKRSKIGRRGKIGLTILIAAMFIGVASAGLLTHYGSIETTVDVKASVQIRTPGGNWHPYNEPIKSFKVPEVPGGESFCYKFLVWNRASVQAPIWFETKPDWSDNGITANVYAFPTELTTLELTSKDPNTWLPTPGMKATLTFNPVSPTFDYDLTATGLTADVAYALIYYADKDLRFDPSQWGGDNPGALIGTFTAGTDGTVSLTGETIDLNMNLPCEPDWNIHPDPNYCDYNNTYDDYEHGEGGAKIWIVPLDDLTTGGVLPVKNWHPTEFLFETDLISYSDCDIKVVPWTMTLWADKIESAIIPSGEEVPFFVCYAFELEVWPTVYTITTYVKPGTPS